MRQKIVFAFALLASCGFATLAIAQGAQTLPTNGVLETRFGKIELENGFPSQASVEKLYDELDFQRAVQAYLWALPLMAMTEWQRQQRTAAGQRACHRYSCLPCAEKTF